MTRPSSQALRNRALHLARLADHPATGEPEANTAARQLAKLLAAHPELLEEHAESEGITGDDSIDAMIERGMATFAKHMQGVDTRSRCEACNQPAAQLRYGKCAACWIAAAKNAKTSRQARGHGR